VNHQYQPNSDVAPVYATPAAMCPERYKIRRTGCDQRGAFGVVAIRQPSLTSAAIFWWTLHPAQPA